MKQTKTIHIISQQNTSIHSKAYHNNTKLSSPKQNIAKQKNIGDEKDGRTN